MGNFREQVAVGVWAPLGKVQEAGLVFGRGSEARIGGWLHGHLDLDYCVQESESFGHCVLLCGRKKAGIQICLDDSVLRDNSAGR